MAKIKITLKKSVIGSTKDVKGTVQSLGLHKTNDTVIQENTPEVQGKIAKLRHLLTVEEMAQ